MKIKFEAPEHEGTEPLESQAFGIRDRDMHLIIDMLRSKLYKDPMLAVCREYMCNARDAHREIGTPELPIEVTLPTALNRQLEVKDFGPGISPRRMADIFLNYGASTKRRDNTQTGGFGIGGKSALALSNSFSVVSVYDGVKRHYTAFIDSSNMGRMDLIHEEETTEHTGTTIIVPIKQDDEAKCARAVVTASKYWAVRPTLINMPLGVEYPEFNEPLLSSEEDGWTLAALNRTDRSGNYSEPDKAMVIVDGIGYTVRHGDIGVNAYDNDTNWIRSLLEKHLLMHFKTGQISLVPSRDNILFNDTTIKAITKRLEKVRDAVYNHAIDKVATAPSLLEAELFWEEINSLLSWIAKKDSKGETIWPSWNGIQLLGTKLSMTEAEARSELVKIRGYYLDNTRMRSRRRSRNLTTFTNDDRKFSSMLNKSITLGRHTAIFWNDTDKERGFGCRVEKFLRSQDEQSPPEIKRVFFFNFANDEVRDHWLNVMRLSELGAQPASTLPEMDKQIRGSRKVSTASVGPRETIDCWVFDPSWRGDKEHEYCWRPTTIDKYAAGFPSEPGIYIESINKAQQQFDCGPLTYASKVKEAIEYCKVTEPVYLIPRRLLKMVDPSWKRLDHVVEAQLTAIFSMATAQEMAHAFEAKEWYADNVLPADCLYPLKRLIEGNRLAKTNPVVSLIEETRAARNLETKMSDIKQLQYQFAAFRPVDGAAVAQTLVTMPEHTIKLLCSEVRELYPFLFSSGSRITEEHILTYIEAMDYFHTKSQNNVETEPASTEVDMNEPDNYCIAV